MTKLNRKSWRKFAALAAPYWSSDQRWTARGLVALLVVLLLAYTQFSVTFNRLTGDFASALAAQDGDRFWSGLRLYLILLILAVPINALYYYVRDRLGISWRRWLTTRFLGDYFSDRSYYELVSHPTIDNPDQRIAEDINTFTQRSLQFLLIAVSGLLQLLAFSAVLWSISKVLVVFLVVYAVMGTTIAVGVFGRGLTILNYLQLKREADFRFSLVRVRENVESIAFYQGEERELSVVKLRFDEAFRNYLKLIWWQFYLSVFQYANTYASYLLPYVILAPAILRGEIEVGRVVEAGGAFAACLTALNLVIDNFDSLSKFAAGIDRLDSFSKAITTKPVDASSTDVITYTTGDGLTLAHVTLKIPNHERVLIQDLSVSIDSGKNLVIAGPSGCGKTSLLRAIVGLWTHGAGTIMRPDLTEVLFLPQRPYMILGNLRTQLLYPRLDMAVSEDELHKVLKRVKLAHLSESPQGLDAEADWSKVLSIGEQQRLSFARLLLVKPKYAFLDEATSALDHASEENLYRQLKGESTTVVSISHHAAVLQYHQLILELQGEGKWRLRDVNDEDRKAGNGSVEKTAGPSSAIENRGKIAR